MGVREETCVLAYGTLLGNVESIRGITKRLHESKVECRTKRFESSFVYVSGCVRHAVQREIQEAAVCEASLFE